MVITMAEENIKTRIAETQAEIDALEAEKGPHNQAIANLGDEITTLEAQKEPHIEAIVKLEAEIVARQFLMNEFKGLLPEEEPIDLSAPESEPIELVSGEEPIAEPEPDEPAPEEDQPPSD